MAGLHWLGTDAAGQTHYIERLIGGAKDLAHKNERGVRINGELVWFRQVNYKPSGVPHICNTGCRTATHPECSCQCHGKNHGIANRGTTLEVAEKDIVEVAR